MVKSSLWHEYCSVPGLMATTRMLPITVGIVLVIMMYKKHTALTFPFDFGSMEAVPVILWHVWLMCMVCSSTVLFFIFLTVLRSNISYTCIDRSLLQVFTDWNRFFFISSL